MIVLKVAALVVVSGVIAAFEVRLMRHLLDGRRVRIPTAAVVLLPVVFLLYLSLPITLAKVVTGDAWWGSVSAAVVVAPVFAALFIDAMPAGVRRWIRGDVGGE